MYFELAFYGTSKAENSLSSYDMGGYVYLFVYYLVSGVPEVMYGGGDEGIGYNWPFVRTSDPYDEGFVL